MRRAATALPALLALCALSCAPRPRRVDEVAFWQYGPPEVVQPLLARFEAAHPGLRVRLRRLPRAGGLDTLRAALAAGHPPDLCQVAGDDMPALLASGALADWSAGVADQRDSLAGWELCRVGDALYGLPWLLDTRALFYDKALFARAGLDSSRAPDTWAGLYRAAARIQRLGRGVHGYGIPVGGAEGVTRFLPFLWSAGGEVLSARADSVRLDSPEAAQALEFYRSLRAVGTLAPADSLEREFAAGRLGLVLAGGETLAHLERDAGGLRWGVALVPAPEADSARTSVASGEVLVSFNASRRKEEGLRLARFLARPENALAVAVAAHCAPATAGADTGAWALTHPRARVLLAQLASVRFPPGVAAWPDMATVLEDELEQVLDDRAGVTRAIADAQVRLAALVGRP